jgi:two-component system chemotaxis response regulator CheB
MAETSIVVASPDARQRTHLAGIVDRMPRFTVIARTADLMNTYNEVEERLPKAVLIADVLARLPEFEVMRALFSALDIRWLIVTSNPASNGSVLQPRAATADLFAVPSDASPDEIATQLLSLTRTAPSRKPPALKAALGHPPVRRADAAQMTTSSARGQPTNCRHAAPPTAPLRPALATRPEGRPRSLVVIGASTGGVDALLTLLGAFDEHCPATLIVQHTGAGFGESLAALLDRQCRARVQLVHDSIDLQTGLVLVGAGTRQHLVIEDRATLRAGLSGTTPESGHLPSVDALFRSAVPLGPRVCAALLTGMGRDGAEGLRALHDAGAYTVAQDQASSVVYGMPRAAVALGATDAVLPIGQIGPALLKAAARAGQQGKEVH